MRDPSSDHLHHSGRDASMRQKLPHEVRAAVEFEVGPVTTLTALGGLSGRTVVAAHGQRGIVVVKGPVAAGELAVATSLRPVFEAGGVLVADASAITTAGGQPWLLIEHLPRALPRERWGADPGVLAVLRSVHGLPVEPVAQISDRYLPRWDEALTTSALDTLRVPAPLVRSVHKLARDCRYLFEPLAVVSADPNPLNWRVGPTGAPVLIDWERVTLAHPAVDLGILLPGVGDIDTARRIARAYGDDSVDEVDLLRVKAWSLIELAATSPSESDSGALLEQVREDALELFASLT